MDIARIKPYRCLRQEGQSDTTPVHAEDITPTTARDLIVLTATLLFVNGQTTERMKEVTEHLAQALGFRATLFPYWGELIIRIDGRGVSRYEVSFAEPVSINMSKVAATVNLVDSICAGRITPKAAYVALQAIERLPPISVLRFALLAAAGAMALGVTFGAEHPMSLFLIALSAGVGACLRRWLDGISHDPFVQPFVAALLAGAIGAIAVHLQLSTAQRLIAVCPCLVLVPGPHLLNGAIDLVRGRISLGVSRIGYASLTTVMICTGLLVGLSLGGITLPVSAPSHPVPFAYDVIAAGVAVAAYGTFFAMPWRMLPIPILIGMLAHAARWLTISAGCNLETGALVACLLVGIVVTSISDRLRLPFAAVAFASVVSLIPGVFLFHMGGGFVDLVVIGEKASPGLLVDALTDGMTAILIILVMTFGLILPKMFVEHFYPGAVGSRRR